MAFRIDGADVTMSSGMRTYRRVAWYERLSLHRVALVLCIAIFVIGAVAVPVAVGRRRFWRVTLSPDLRRACGLAWAISVLQLAFVVGLARPFLGDDGVRWVTYGVSTSYRWQFVLPPLAGLVAVVLLGLLAQRLRKQRQGYRSVGLLAAPALASATFLVVLSQWNLLGFHG
jgi:hypothetical protein